MLHIKVPYFVSYKGFSDSGTGICLCVTGLVVPSVLKEVTYRRPVYKICSSGKTSELCLEVNIYNIGKSTDYADVGFSCLYSDPPGNDHTALQTWPYSLACQPFPVH
jgi:hypothetical protein